MAYLFQKLQVPIRLSAKGLVAEYNCHLMLPDFSKYFDAGARLGQIRVECLRSC